MAHKIPSDVIIYGKLGVGVDPEDGSKFHVAGSSIISGTVQIFDGVALDHAAAVGQMNSAISGQITTHNHDGVYVEVTPSDTSDNTVEAGGGSVIPLTLLTPEFSTAKIQSWQIFPGSEVAYVDSAGKIFGSGLDAQGSQLSNIDFGDDFTDGVSLDQVYTILSGMVTGSIFAVDHGGATGKGDDDHTHYIHEAPGDADRNTISSASDFRLLHINRTSSGSSSIAEIENSDITASSRWNNACKFFAEGLDAKDSAVSSVAAASAMTEAPNWDQVMSIISGNLPYYEHLYARTIIAATSEMNVFQESSATNALEIPVGRKCKLKKVVVNSQKDHPSQPGDWIMTLFKNQSSTPFAMFDFSFHATNSTDQVTQGDPTVYPGESLVLDGGDRYEVVVSGAQIDVAVAVRIALGWEIHPNQIH